MSVTDAPGRNDTEAGLLSERGLAGWEVVSIASSVLIAEWILSVVAGPGKLIVAIPVSLAFAFIIASHVLRRETARELGLRFDNFLGALKLLLLPMIAIAIVSFAIGMVTRTRPDFFRWHSERMIALQLAFGFAWGFLQQYVLQGFINRRAQMIWGRGPLSVLLTAFIFSALHLPNPWLMVVTFVGGLVWALVYQRQPNLFALAISHSVMTWVLVSTLPPSALNHLRIGFKYFA